MIDFHNHILPNADDGSKTIEESIEMLKFAEEQGITEVVNTVHFQHPKMEGKNVDFAYLKELLEILQSRLNNENIKIKLHLTAEVFYLPNLLEISSNPLVTFGNKKYMLIEFKTNIYPTGFEEEFYRLQLSGITPMIAHPERYRFVQNNLSIIQDWIDRDYLIQIDAGSIVGFFGKQIKKIAKDMCNNGFVHLIGSDAHNNVKRNFCLKEGYSILEKEINCEFVINLKENITKLLDGKKINKH